MHVSCMQMSACSAAGEMLYKKGNQHRQLQLHNIESLRHAGHEADEAPGEVSPQGLSPCLFARMALCNLRGERA